MIYVDDLIQEIRQGMPVTVAAKAFKIEEGELQDILMEDRDFYRLKRKYNVPWHLVYLAEAFARSPYFWVMPYKDCKHALDGMSESTFRMWKIKFQNPCSPNTEYLLTHHNAFSDMDDAAVEILYHTGLVSTAAEKFGVPKDKLRDYVIYLRDMRRSALEASA